jgi:hypothetical protein
MAICIVSLREVQTEVKMTALRRTLLCAAAGASVLALSAISASAAIVCTGNVCWHTRQAYEYPPHAGVTVHPDTWKWGPSERYSWREHEGRGYWSGERWMEF